MLVECLESIRGDISKACSRIKYDTSALQDINKAIGRIDNFLTILSYLNNTEEVE